MTNSPPLLTLSSAQDWAWRPLPGPLAKEHIFCVTQKWPFVCCQGRQALLRRPCVYQKGEEWRRVGNAEAPLGENPRLPCRVGIPACRMQVAFPFGWSGSLPPHFLLLLTSSLILNPSFCLFQFSGLFLLFLFLLPLPPSFSLSGKARKVLALEWPVNTTLLLPDSHPPLSGCRL